MRKEHHDVTKEADAGDCGRRRGPRARRRRGRPGDRRRRRHPGTGPQADQAKAAALKIVKGGEVNAVERDGENGATWEVEVTKTDGSTVDVRLDAGYGLVVVESDSEDGGSK
jgi:uncharacterized membrane protein YkoI